MNRRQQVVSGHLVESALDNAFAHDFAQPVDRPGRATEGQHPGRDARVVRVDTKIGGFRVRAGSKVMMCFASAAHDPARFDDPDSFDVDRADAELHMAFGKGSHLCLGASHPDPTQPPFRFPSLQIIRYAGDGKWSSEQDWWIASEMTQYAKG